MIIQQRAVHRQKFNVPRFSGDDENLGVVTAQATPFDSGDLIKVSVTSGLIVWVVTRFLNGVLGGSR